MIPDTPEQTVRAIYEAFARGDLPTLLASLTPDAEWRCSASADMPCKGTRRGPAGAQEFFGALFSVVRMQAVIPDGFLPHGEQVVVLGRDVGTWISTGRPYAADWVHVWTVRNGKVTSWREFLDVRE